MIPKIDSYFYDALTRYVNVVLNSIGTENERYIIDEALGNMEQGTLDKFKKAFAGSKKTIDITYSFPKQKEPVDARYVIYRGDMVEDDGAIGSVQGVAAEARPANGENIVTDYVKVQKDDAGYFVELSQPVYDVVSIDEVSDTGIFLDFYAKDNDPRRLNLNDNIKPFLGFSITVAYNVEDTGPREDYGGVALGFSANESIVVQSVSNNMDTVRCLDSILKYVLIIMRSSAQESRFYQLAKVNSKGLQIADEMVVDNPVYVIPTIVSYKVSYSVRNDSKAVIERILINGKDK